MTLVDSRPASQRTLEFLASDHGYDIDVASLMAGYGLPLSKWLPPDCDHSLFWSVQSKHLSSAKPMPGAVAAIAAARKAGARPVVITAAQESIAIGILDAIGLSVDVVRAGVWASGKVQPLREENCWAFVGDHTADMSAARQAGAVAVGVATGMSRPSGADVELEDLNAFAPWLASQVHA
jgi:phosphoglycolate phosphatase